MHTEEFITIMEAGRLKVLERLGDEKALDARTLDIAEEVDKHYIEGVLIQDLLSILNDIREKHFADSTAADAPYAADEAQKKINDAMNFQGELVGEAAVSCVQSVANSVQYSKARIRYTIFHKKKIGTKNKHIPALLVE